MPALTRRRLLQTGLLAVGAGALAACKGSDVDDARDRFVGPDSARVAEVEARRNPGPVRRFTLTAVAGPVDLGGQTVTTWTYNGHLPGAPIRVRAGEQVRVDLANRLPAPTSVHWHGLALRNNADGVPDVTQPNIRPGAHFSYQFTARQPGTFWFHPHTGTQLDRGLYAPLIVDDPAEPLSYDHEWIVVLDDWLDGVNGTPDDVFAELRKGMAMDGSGGMATGGHMAMGATSVLLGGDASDVTYPYFLLNGRLPDAPDVLRARPGDRVRIRIVNAGADTAFRVALGGHQLRVTHTDGSPVQPADTDALLVGMGERYDVLVTVGSGVFPLVALAEGKNATTRGLIRTGDTAAPPLDARPRELDGRVVSYRWLPAADTVRLPPRPIDRTVELKLTGSMMRYDWGINGRRYDPRRISELREGERVKLSFVNTTTMWHPIHLHGHTFALEDAGTRKDTVIVRPGETVNAVFDADNPGLWMLHCHNVYHAEAGMMALLGYRR